MSDLLRNSIKAFLNSTSNTQAGVTADQLKDLTNELRELIADLKQQLNASNSKAE